MRALLLASIVVCVAGDVCVGACHPPQRPAAPTTGGIGGLVRDHDSGAAIAVATLAVVREGELEPETNKSLSDGSYLFTRLAPGRYTVTAHFAGATVEVSGVDVGAGHVTALDLALDLGRPEEQHLDYGNAKDGAIDHYKLAGGDPALGVLEGTVTDSATRERVPGAVVTATSPVLETAMQAITDDHGRFALPDLPPGSYAVSAYYSMAGHGQIEVKHTSVAVVGGEGVVVPLWVELEGD